MSNHWDMYFCSIEDKFASIVLDMDIWKEIEREEYPVLKALRIIIKNPEASGTPHNEEAEVMNDLEDLVTDEIQESGFNVGRLTTDGVRDVYYYFSRQIDLRQISNKHFSEHGYEIEIFDINEDNAWDFYFEFLYPDKYQIQHMGNRKVIDSLSKSGDLLEEARRVDHWIYFNTTLDRDSFITKAKTLGFNDETDYTDNDRIYAQINRVDHVDFHSVNDVTDLLVELAGEFNGEYDGWETMVIT